MDYFKQFFTFNPLSGVLTNQPFAILSAIADRARAILKNRTEYEIYSAAMDIDWAVNEYFRQRKEEEIERMLGELNRLRSWKREDVADEYEYAERFFDWIVDDAENEHSPESGHWQFKEDMVDRITIPGFDIRDEVTSLKRWRQEYDFEEIGSVDFPNGRDYEYFAALSLCLIVEAIKCCGRKTWGGLAFHLDGKTEYFEGRAYDSHAHELRIRSLGGDFVAKAMDAVCHSEHLLEASRLNAEAGKAISDLQARQVDFAALGGKGASIRHAPMRKLNEWTLSQYRSGKWESANKAAHELKEMVIAHGRTIGAALTEENAQRTIAEWIRKAGRAV